MSNSFAIFNTTEMCAILNEVGIETFVKSRIIIIKLIEEAIQEGKIDFTDGKLRAITPVRKRSKSKLTLEKLMLRDGIRDVESPRMEIIVKKINMESPRTDKA